MFHASIVKLKGAVMTTTEPGYSELLVKVAESRDTYFNLHFI